MKIKLIITLAIFISFNLQAKNLTKVQINKLNSSVIQIENNTFIIQEYNNINFTKKIFFNGENLDQIVVETKAIMKKGIIHKEQFIAISSTISDQIIQSIFMNPQYYNDIKSIELLTSKPLKVNLTLYLEFKKNGLNTTVINGQREEKQFMPYNELFHQRLQ